MIGDTKQSMKTTFFCIHTGFTRIFLFQFFFFLSEFTFYYFFFYSFFFNFFFTFFLRDWVTAYRYIDFKIIQTKSMRNDNIIT